MRSSNQRARTILRAPEFQKGKEMLMGIFDMDNLSVNDGDDTKK